MPLPIIKRKVQEVCPEILELKFGCEVNILFDISTSPQKIIGINADRTVRTEQYSSLNTQDLEILGSEIRLSHILRTIQAKYGINDLAYYAGVRMTGNVQLLNICAGGGECDWDLEHDSLDWHATHRPETVAFIGGLIK